MLRELGVGLGLCLLGGGLSVLVSTTVVFADRLQAVSLQWLPLAVFFAVRFWRRGRRGPGGGLRRVRVPDRPGQPVHRRHAARRGAVPGAAPPRPAGRDGGPAPRDGARARRCPRRRALPARPEAVRRGPRGRGRLLDGGVRLREDLERGHAHGPPHEPARVRVCPGGGWRRPRPGTASIRAPGSSSSCAVWPRSRSRTRCAPGSPRPTPRPPLPCIAPAGACSPSCSPGSRVP